MKTFVRPLDSLIHSRIVPGPLSREAAHKRNVRARSSSPRERAGRTF